MKQRKRIKLYHIQENAARQSFVMNSDDHLNCIAGDLCQNLSGDKTGQRDSKAFNIFRTSALAVFFRSGEQRSNELSLFLCHRNLQYIQRFHMGIH